MISAIVVNQSGKITRVTLENPTDFVYLPDFEAIEKVNLDVSKPENITILNKRYKLRETVQVVQSIPIYTECIDSEEV